MLARCGETDDAVPPNTSSSRSPFLIDAFRIRNVRDLLTQQTLRLAPNSSSQTALWVQIGCQMALGCTLTVAPNALIHYTHGG
jgi:hypothetical protein